MEESEIKETKIKTKVFRPITSFFSAKKNMLLDEKTSDFSCNNDFYGKFKLLGCFNVYSLLEFDNKNNVYSFIILFIGYNNSYT